MPEPFCLCPLQEFYLGDGLRTKWNRVVNGERSVIAKLKPDRLQEDDNLAMGLVDPNRDRSAPTFPGAKTRLFNG